jgi:hypothetical protein
MSVVRMAFLTSPAPDTSVNVLDRRRITLAPIYASVLTLPSEHFLVRTDWLVFHASYTSSGS